MCTALLKLTARFRFFYSIHTSHLILCAERSAYHAVIALPRGTILSRSPLISTERSLSKFQVDFKGTILVMVRGACSPNRARGRGTSRESATELGPAPIMLTWDEQVHRMEVGDERNPGVAICWASDVQLHNCLGVTGAPVSQGASPSASGIVMRTWFSNIVTRIAPNAPVVLPGGDTSSEFFHHLRVDRYGQVVNALQAVPIMFGWGGNLNTVGLSAGRFYKVTSKRRGRNKTMRQIYAPFL